ncbi:putative chromosome segregation SMC protein [Sulfuriferula multivorans]|uniref:Putative chromosome segregation SMC protein n=1 Tax=Sulfuriferula multivorans TaxID=1559896 RepID=A0A401JC00_9PROT|nr:hypothetical protein [Sulfuriferula multivorans]GBL45066.1 putative chromosome segregation SMC protein [Sulfuriferula multivorans]
MATWLQADSTPRSFPRLWIERLWLLESKEPLAVVRTIDLHPGLNIVWAREPESEAASGLASAGHGVGKTSLCLLLRYCLGDEAPSISSLREKALAGFPKGGVAAKVHVDGTTWLVYRPYGTHSHSSAGKGEELESLLAGGLDGDFSAFSAALHEAFIAKLPATSLPGSSQTLEWRHLLAWCIRDQKTRFDGFFHWRDGDGLGFRRPRQDPPLFVHTVLGLLDADTDRLMREVEHAQSDLINLEQELEALERESIFELAHLERKLRAQFKADDDLPVLETILGPSLQSMVADALAEAVRAETTLERETEAAEENLAPLLVELEALRREAAIREKEREIAQSLLDANEADYIRLTTELQQLENLAGHCRHGDVDFSKCDYILSRRSTPSLPWRLSQREAEANKPKLRAAVQAATVTEQAATAELRHQVSLVNAKQAEIRRLQVRIGTSEAQRDYLKSVWGDLQPRIAARAGGKDSRELELARSQQQKLTQELNAKKTALVKQNQVHSVRAEALKVLTRSIAARLLGEEGYGRFVPESDDHPFEISVGGEAYQVLEVLLGDMTCLLDAAIALESHHPGFAVHDCPREADMSERLYREFLLTAAEAAELMFADGAVPFQYIVTTTSAPPAALQTTRYVVLELLPGAEEHLLFKRRLLPQLFE